MGNKNLKGLLFIFKKLILNGNKNLLQKYDISLYKSLYNSTIFDDDTRYSILNEAVAFLQFLLSRLHCPKISSTTQIS